MSIVIRPFAEDADYDRLEETEKLIYPDEWDSADFYRAEDKQQVDYPSQRWLAFDGDRPIGNAEYLKAHWWDDPNQFVFYIGVIPDYWGRGVGKQLYETVMATLAEHGATAAMTWAREDHARAHRFMSDRGYEMTQRDAQSELVLATFDREPFTENAAKMRQFGVTVYSIADLQKRDDAWLQKLYDLDWPIRQDIPSTEEPKRETLEKWKERRIASPYALMDGFMIAVTDNGEYVGYSSTYKDSSGAPKLKTGVTGVLREWRRKGVAIGMKLAIIDFALANGYEKIITENEENNPMYDLNMALGFRPIPAWLTYKKVMRKT